MIALHGKADPIVAASERLGLLTITTNPNLPRPLAERSGLVLSSDVGQIPSGYKAVLIKGAPQTTSGSPLYCLPAELNHLTDGDVIALDSESGRIRVLFRKESNHNSILLTERCNHYCLMCSQPPKNIDDSWILEETKELIRLIPQDTKEIGFTGGEPTLYGDGFIELLSLVKSYLPNTAVHILSNGRRFKDIEFARRYAQVQLQDVMVGIPIYSDDPVRHNYVVQADGAFDETIRGVLNLKSLGQRVEIRVVLHKQTIDRLVPLAKYLARNLLFVDHVALMGLEITGFTRANLDLLWIDPFEYKDKLSEAVKILQAYGMNVSVYNHQRCLVNDDILSAYRKSISDWKNEYMDACATCVKREECGGFFTSQLKFKTSAYIKPFQ